MVSPRRLRRGDSEARRETPAVKAGASGRWNPYRSAWARPSSRIIGPDGPADSALRCPARRTVGSRSDRGDGGKYTVGTESFLHGKHIDVCIGICI